LISAKKQSKILTPQQLVQEANKNINAQNKIRISTRKQSDLKISVKGLGAMTRALSKFKRGINSNKLSDY